MIVAFFIFKWKVREGQILKAAEHISSRPSEDGCEWKVETDIGRKTETDIHRRRNGR